MDIERIVAFVITMVVIGIFKSVIKFGFKVLIALALMAFVVYFAIPELIPIGKEFIDGFI